MKKILMLLMCLILTGCFADSGTITKQCTKIEKINTLNSNIEYTFTFKQDKIKELKIVYDYNDENSNTIKSIKNSMISESKSLGIPNNVLIDNNNQYKIEYFIPLNNSNLLTKLNLKLSRTELVNDLKEQGYKCS